jgi:hypothetical protein
MSHCSTLAPQGPHRPQTGSLNCQSVPFHVLSFTARTHRANQQLKCQKAPPTSASKSNFSFRGLSRWMLKSYPYHLAVSLYLMVETAFPCRLKATVPCGGLDGLPSPWGGRG